MGGRGTYEGENSDEVPFYVWVVGEEGDVHAEEAGDEG